mmetsp:Transcript_80021/g.248319  ORF Transcript_80021/g.248319 Transcript_80021/m.248319 type:complete len:397 (+) Transcript_80021:67-1257(+)
MSSVVDPSSPHSSPAAGMKKRRRVADGKVLSVAQVQHQNAGVDLQRAKLTECTNGLKEHPWLMDAVLGLIRQASQNSGMAKPFPRGVATMGGEHSGIPKYHMVALLAKILGLTADTFSEWALADIRAPFLFAVGAKRGTQLPEQKMVLNAFYQVYEGKYVSLGNVLDGWDGSKLDWSFQHGIFSLVVASGQQYVTSVRHNATGKTQQLPDSINIKASKVPAEWRLVQNYCQEDAVLESSQGTSIKLSVLFKNQGIGNKWGWEVMEPMWNGKLVAAAGPSCPPSASATPTGVPALQGEIGQGFDEGDFVEQGGQGQKKIQDQNEEGFQEGQIEKVHSCSVSPSTPERAYSSTVASSPAGEGLAACQASGEQGQPMLPAGEGAEEDEVAPPPPPPPAF